MDFERFQTFTTKKKYDTLPETNELHLKMDGWETIPFIFGGNSALFSGALFAVSFRDP